MQIWNKNDSWYQKHDNSHWTVCYEDDCTTHLLEKKEEYFLKTFKKYRKKKEIRWAIWNAERAKISHQIDEFSKKFDDKLKLLKMRQEKRKEMKERIKATSFW